MSELIAITYQTEQRARDVMAAVQRMQLAHVVDIADACYVTRDARGHIELHPSINTIWTGDSFTAATTSSAGGAS